MCHCNKGNDYWGITAGQGDGGNDDYKTMGGMSVSDFPGDIAERTWQTGL